MRNLLYVIADNPAYRMGNQDISGTVPEALFTFFLLLAIIAVILRVIQGRNIF